MTEETALKVTELSKKLIICKNLMQKESRASIPDTYLSNIKQLVMLDDSVRSDFYKLINALAIKYSKIYREQIKNL